MEIDTLSAWELSLVGMQEIGEEVGEPDAQTVESGVCFHCLLQSVKGNRGQL
jgi:hypothetical protein